MTGLSLAALSLVGSYSQRSGLMRLISLENFEILAGLNWWALALEQGLSQWGVDGRKN